MGGRMIGYFHEFYFDFCLADMFDFPRVASCQLRIKIMTIFKHECLIVPAILVEVCIFTIGMTLQLCRISAECICVVYFWAFYFISSDCVSVPLPISYLLDNMRPIILFFYKTTQLSRLYYIIQIIILYYPDYIIQIITFF